MSTSPFKSGASKPSSSSGSRSHRRLHNKPGVESVSLSQALIITAGMAGLIGLCSGAIIRFSLSNSPNARFLSPLQTFPTLSNWAPELPQGTADDHYLPGGTSPDEKEPYSDTVEEPWDSEPIPTFDSAPPQSGSSWVDGAGAGDDATEVPDVNFPESADEDYFPEAIYPETNVPEVDIPEVDIPEVDYPESDYPTDDYSGAASQQEDYPAEDYYPDVEASNTDDDAYYGGDEPW